MHKNDKKSRPVVHLERIAQSALNVPDGHPFHLEYYIVTYRHNTNEEHYGFQINKLHPCGTLIESAVTHAVSNNREATHKMMNALVATQVTTTHLHEIIDDMHHDFNLICNNRHYDRELICA